MPFSDSFDCPVGLIVVDRATRQRRTLTTDGLMASIRRHGVVNPIVITRDYNLVAGERRLETCRTLGHPTIPARFHDNLSPEESYEVELEENIKRSDLCWQDIIRTVAELHTRYRRRDPSWTQSATAEANGLTPGTITIYLRVAQDLDDQRIAACNTVRAAYDLLQRRDGRLADDAMSEVLEAGEQLLAPGPIEYFNPSKDDIGQLLTRPAPSLLPEARAVPILNEDFLLWAPTYSGPKFNIIHCDFPYGVNAFAGGSNRQHGDVGYLDKPEIYWSLVYSLCENLDRLMAYSGHLLFWFSMNYYEETLEAFSHLAPSLTFDPFPLVWHKSDNTGMVPDPSRGPRRTYETAFLASREDRKIVKVVANSYAAPVDKTHHPSAKPVSVLKHFLSMLVDEGSRVLDPTCGSGSALRASECLGAKAVLGLEIDKEHWETARRVLREDRAKRALSRG